MVKFRLYYDKDAETEWLNDLVHEGWALERFFAGFYFFKNCKPGEYIYQVDFGDRFGHVSRDYREFMEEMNVEIVQNWGPWIILRRSAAEGEFELYTDVESSIEHYRKIRNMFKGCVLLELICFLLEIFAGIAGNNWGYVFALLIAAFMFAMINVVMQTNDILANLEEKKTGISQTKSMRRVSSLVPMGLLMNSAALLIQESVSRPIKLAVQILAIVMMLAGIWQTAKKR